MLKRKFDDITTEEKTEFLKTLLPGNASITTRITNNRFDGWNVFRVYKGFFAFIPNFLAVPCLVVSNNMQFATRFMDNAFVMDVVERLHEGIWKEYRIRMNDHGVPPYMTQKY